MDTQRTARVEFPTTGSVPALNAVQVIGYPPRHHGVISCAHPTKREEVKRVLGYTRHDEGIETIDIDVVAQFADPDFDGHSYSLALALADKQARCGGQGPYRRLIATGILGKQGKISRVEAFREKVALVAPLLDNGTLFIFPQDNAEAEPAVLAGQTMTAGHWRAVRRLDELRDLWQADAPALTLQAPGNRWRVFFKGLILGFAVVMLAAGVIVWYWPS